MSVCSLPLRSSRRISLSAAASGSLQVFLQTMKRVSSCTRRGSGHIAECFVQTRKITPVNSIVHSIHNIASDTDNIFVIHNIPPAFRTDSGTVRSVCITDGRHLHNLTLYYTPSQNKKTLSERGRISEEKNAETMLFVHALPGACTFTTKTVTVHVPSKGVDM